MVSSLETPYFLNDSTNLGYIFLASNGHYSENSICFIRSTDDDMRFSIEILTNSLEPKNTFMKMVLSCKEIIVYLSIIL